MKIQVINRTKTKIDINKIVELSNSILSEENLSERNSYVNIVITNDEEITKYNRKFRNKDGPTDVLSFEYGLDEETIGDIVISYETVASQAPEYNNSVQKELYLMIIHGLLHLLGFDHENNENDAKVMFDKQNYYSNKYIEEG
ncbi:MAG: rRNA maturation RNase YbeY [Kosmotogaceae bacterium]